jgi:crotonobetainyl-CoA:carnitine CoA-transferase CaiB-like acyl-CoA transferase
MHSMRPQKLAAVGLAPGPLCARHPRLVYVGLHGFAEHGPYGGQPAYDDIIQGLSGLAALMQAQSPGSEPRYLPAAAADKTCGLVAALAIQAAQLRRAATGRGGVVEVPMFETMVAHNLVEHGYGQLFDPPRGPAGYPRVLAAWRKPYRTADGHVCLMPYTDAHWQRFFQAADQPALAADPRFASMAARTQHIAALYEATGLIVATQPTAHWLALCDRLQIPAARMNTLDDLQTDPHLLATGFFQPLDDAAMGRLRLPGVPVLFDGQRPPVGMPPRLGEHTLATLQAAGLDDSTLAQLQASGAIGVWQPPLPAAAPKPVAADQAG